MTDDDLRDRIRPFLKGSESEILQFVALMSYVNGKVMPQFLMQLVVGQRLV